MTSPKLVDGTGRATLATIGARDVPYGLGEHAPVREVPPAWREAGGFGVEEWTISWVSVGARVRASGKVTAAGPASYREPALAHALEPADDGVPVLLSSRR